MQFLEVSPLTRLLTHTRFLLTLRSGEGTYHQLIVFRLSSTTDTPANQFDGRPDATSDSAVIKDQLYAMEAACPHLGADMSHAEIEECETGVVAVCPWHRYDFDLRTGQSETGLKACTYAIELRDGADGAPAVWLQAPEGGNDWRLVELRPVSEDFADPPPKADRASQVALAEPQKLRLTEGVIPTAGAPKTLIEWAVLILNTSDPALKVERTRHAVHLFRTGKLASIGHRAANAPRPPDTPPREALYVQNTVDVGQMKQRKSRVVMLHALANIEQWAIDLAWDIIARFGPVHTDLPPAFFADWAKVALDESKHFSLLCARLRALGAEYGVLPVHAALWESARVTADSLRARLAIIHLVHEARGLDVNPGTIEKFRRQGDKESVATLEIIHTDEVTHVTAGHRWFTHCCAKDGVDPIQTFREEVRKGWRGAIKGPFNAEDRERAGMTKDFYENLKGEMGLDWQEKAPTPAVKEPAKILVGYE